MMTLAYPLLLLLFLLPLLVKWFMPAKQTPQAALRVPFLIKLSQILGEKPHSGSVTLTRNRWQRLGLWLCWLLVVMAVSRPQWIEEPITRELPMRDLMLAVDLSGSMGAEDFVGNSGQTVDRLSAVKDVLQDFIAKRKGDRLGLIFFGTAAFLQAPFTEDLTLCQQLLEEAQVRMAGPKTAFGDAIGLAIKHFEQSTMEKKVLIVLTDGNDTASQIPPRKAAAIAAEKGITIYTVGIGNPESVGEEAFDEEELRAVAEASKGTYFNAQDGEQLQEVYAQIEVLEPQDVNTQSYRPKTDLFYIPLLAMVASLFLFQAIATLSAFKKRRNARRSDYAAA